MKIKELFSDESKWTTLVPARNVNGEIVNGCDPEATCWCIVGAAYKCYPDFNTRQLVIGKIEEQTGDGIGDWNDTHTFAEVKALMEKLDI